MQFLGRHRFPAFTYAFLLFAAALSLSSTLLATVEYSGGNATDAMLLAAIAVLTGWMTTAIYQFQTRIDALDQVIAQAKQRSEDSDRAVAELKRTLKALEAADAPRDGEERRTLH